MLKPIPKGDVFFEMGIAKESLWGYDEAAKFLQVSVRTLKRRVKRNEVPHLYVGSLVRFAPWKLCAWAERGGSS